MKWKINIVFEIMNELNKKRLILATNNQNKIKEIKSIFSDLNIDIFSLKDLNININPKEDGKTFEENAYIKAKSITKYMIENNIMQDEDIIIADDSGFCIEYLDGAPGVYSSRYLGENTPYNEKFKHILLIMKNVPYNERNCHFETCICMIYKNKTNYFYGKIKGKVASEPKGKEGFGYDPIFYLEEYKGTIAAIGEDIKNKISHRRKALDELYIYMKKEMDIDKYE